MSKVINCKVKNIRPQYRDLEEWMDDENNVYIGRAGIVFINKKRFPSKASTFCNTFKIGKDGDREEVLKKFKEYIMERIKEPQFKEELLKLKDKNLGCWCKPDKCHGDTLMEILTELKYPI